MFCFSLQQRFEVNEGFTCSFLQEAVATDIKEGHYVRLGDVKKSIVVSRDLSDFVDGRCENGKLVIPETGTHGTTT